MLSHRLVRLIEDHAGEITAGAIQQIRAETELNHIARLPSSELEDWGKQILSSLGAWMSTFRDTSLAAHHEDLGRLRFREDVPLHEAVHALNLLKWRMVDFVRNQGFAQTSVELYAEEELEHRVGRFFDWMCYHLVRGYETALREAAHLAATA